MAPYIRKDRMRYGDVKQCIQELIYNLNVPSRWGTQTPFTNLTFDWLCPEDLRGQIPIIGGEEMYFCYGDLQPEMDAINRLYRDDDCGMLQHRARAERRLTIISLGLIYLDLMY
jgi:ribonucleoside-triphosphate reductase (formate)